MLTSFFIPLLLLFQAISGVNAVSAVGSDEIKLELLLKEALAQNPSLAATRHGSLAMSAEIAPAGAYPDPYVAVEYSNFPVDSYRANQSPMTGKEIRFSQKFPFPGKLSKKKRAALHRYNASKEGYMEHQLQLVYLVKKAFFELSLSYQVLDILNEKKNTLSQFAENTKTRYSVGKGLQQDVLKAQVEYSETIKAIITSERDLHSNEARLNSLLNRAAYSPLGKPEAFERTPFDSEKVTQKQLLVIARKFRPAYAEAKNLTLGAESELSFARWDYLPDFELGVKYRIRQANNIDSGTNFASGYVGMSLPLYFFDKQTQHHKAASERSAAAMARESSVLQKLSENIQVAYLSAIEAKKLIELYEANLIPEASQSLQSAELGYQADKVDFLTLLNNEKSLFNHRIEYQKAIVNYEKSIAFLETQVGQEFVNWKKSEESE